MIEQKTIKKEFSFSGRGIHTGENASVVFRPAQKNTGIVFKRADIKNAEFILADIENVHSTVRGTNLSDGKTEIATVEHILSACAGLGITELEIYIDGPEPPIMDGSSGAFARGFITAGIENLGAQRKSLKIDKEISYNSGDVHYTAKPANGFFVNFTYIYKHPLIGKMERRIEVNANNYLNEISSARTFCFQNEVDALKKRGLAKGGTNDNTVVIDDEKFITGKEGLRFKDEIVRHKILDLIGDFALLGPITGMEISSVFGGHKHNVEFAKLLKKSAVTG